MQQHRLVRRSWQRLWNFWWEQNGVNKVQNADVVHVKSPEQPDVLLRASVSNNSGRFCLPFPRAAPLHSALIMHTPILAAGRFAWPNLRPARSQAFFFAFPRVSPLTLPLAVLQPLRSSSSRFLHLLCYHWGLRMASLCRVQSH